MQINESLGLGISPVASTATEDQALQSLFMELMITQIQNQDPFSPMDNSQMVEQLATFSTLEQLQGINARLDLNAASTEALNGVLAETANTNMMLSLPGRRVTIPGDTAELRDGEVDRILVRSPEKAIASIEVKNADGDVVSKFSQVLQGGFNEIDWNGRDEAGNPLADGEYTYSITATANTDEGARSVPVALFRSGIVETVQFDSNGTWVLVDGKRYSIGQIVEVGIGDGQFAASPGFVDDDFGDDEADEGDDGIDTGIGGGGGGPDQDDPIGGPVYPDPTVS